MSGLAGARHYTSTACRVYRNWDIRSNRNRRSPRSRRIRSRRSRIRRSRRHSLPVRSHSRRSPRCPRRPGRRSRRARVRRAGRDLRVRRARPYPRVRPAWVSRALRRPADNKFHVDVTVKTSTFIYNAKCIQNKN